MKKLLIPVFILIANFASAQLNNSWIDHSKTYYKFKIGKDTLTRLSASTLASAGLGNVPGSDFQLWRNGKEVRMYATTSGIFGANDYLEFWGEMNDGKPDNQLYHNPDNQLNDRYSLETDTATFFLAVNPGGTNLRFTDEANPNPGTMTPDPYFMRSIDHYYKMQMNRGHAQVLTEYIYSSAYDQGEGWTSNDANPCCDLTYEFRGLNVYTSGPANSLSLRVNAAGNAPNLNRELKVRIYQNEVFRQSMPLFTHQKVRLNNLPLSLLQSPNQVPIYVNGENGGTNDRVVVAMIGITYPARFVFNNQKSFFFDLKASASGNYLDIESFNNGGVAPVLYDFTEGKRYIGDISTAGRVRFVLPPSNIANRKFLLVNQEGNYAFPVVSLTAKTFTDYSQSAQQGDYLIISHPSLYNDGSGNNYVEEYRAYRSSVSGGSYNAKVYDIRDLIDQFGFGIKSHPAAVRDFVRYAMSTFPTQPKYVLLIGRGMNYVELRNNEANPLTEKLDLIPTFGWPASDMLLASAPSTVTPLVPIGRLAVINGTEINQYLSKVKEYEQAQRNPTPNISGSGWMKNILHVAGGKDTLENDIFKSYMNGYKAIAEDTLFGGYVETFTKTATGAVQHENSQRIRDLFATGLGFIGYFGHSSANTFEFNLSDPQVYNNAGKYPFFNVSGCSAGNFYIFDPLRLNGNMTISERYVLAPNRGSIGFLADTHFGIPPFLNFYNIAFYHAFAKDLYGQPVGNQIKRVIETLGGNNPGLDFFHRIHLEEIALHGDPAVKINYFEKPDYVIEDQLVRINPSIISVTDNNFDVRITMMNIGRATSDSIRVTVKRQLPNDTVRILFNEKIPGIRYSDSLQFTVPINPLTDKGLNKLMVTLDADDDVEELFETNNSITREFYIFEDELNPSYPYNFSIVTQPNITYTASTANPLSGVRQYTMEIDTTELFNSPAKKIYNTSGPGGLVQFTPNDITYVDNQVYYWRVSMVPNPGEQTIWNGYSFIYLPSQTAGFNQSHYYQHKKSAFDGIRLDDDRKFRFDRTERQLTIRTGLHPFYTYDRINVNLDFNQLELYGCVFNNMQVYVFDSTTLTPWRNRNAISPSPGNPGQGLYGSNPVCANSATPLDTSRLFFEFPYNSPAYRKAAMDFLDLIPTGMYVAITNLGNKNTNTSFINQWMDDTLTLGSGNSLYHKLKSLGFTEIDSFNNVKRNLPFLYFFQKGVPSYTPTQVMGPFDSSHIERSFALFSSNVEGSIESPTFGPARSWEELHWRGTTTDADPTKETSSIEVWGVQTNGNADLLTTVYQAQDTSVSFIDANVYPYLRLKLRTRDATYATPMQLDYWRLNGNFAPEGAVAPNILFQMEDTVSQGAPIEFRLAFKNISQAAFDSLIRTKVVITDRNNQSHTFYIPPRKALVAGDTLIATYSIESRNFPGVNTLFVEFNPDNHQPEQYHHNNILYKTFYVQEDMTDPLLDVTFDGVHILNRDIVSAKPNILIKLKDENRFLELKDTSLLTVFVRFPDEATPRRYYFNDTMRFIPANVNAGGDNTASIEFTPHFAADGEYELIVSGRDVVGNNAGAMEHRVIFSVINKPMFSNLLNYPNPFTTSTAFVFTVTGSEVPQNIRIQILTITGKVVREITKEELGPIHIGRNITEFKWDGTDMYGQRLANGVYIYRVLTNLNGRKLDKYTAPNESTDKFFNKGYGKMYLMR